MDDLVRAGCQKKTENECDSRAVPPLTMAYDMRNKPQVIEHAQAA